MSDLAFPPSSFVAAVQTIITDIEMAENDDIIDEYVDLVRFMASSLLEEDVDIEVRGRPSDSKLRIELLVPEDHRGRVIGRGGRIARAMRSLLDNAGIASHRNVVLDIVD